VHHAMRHGAAGIVSFLLAATPVCAEPLRGFQLAAITRDFLFYSRHGEPIDVRGVEQSLRKVEQLLGQKLPGRAAYYRYATPQEVAASVGPYAAGVTFGSLRQIHSTRKSHLHEVVHLVAAQLGDPGPFFHEGLAVALSKERRDRGRRARGLPPSLRGVQLSAVVAGFESLDAQTAYPVAGSFVAFLIKSHGMARVAEFFRACAGSASPREAAFRATFGRTLDEAGAAWAGHR
jgi:hypothetical protein